MKSSILKAKTPYILTIFDRRFGGNLAAYLMLVSSSAYTE
jgi:hypothetical protein